MEPVEHWVWHTGVVRYGVGGQRIETGIGEVQIRITGEKKMDIETFAKMVKAATASQLGSAMMIFKELPGSAAAYAGLNSAMSVAQWVENSSPSQIYGLLHDVGIGKYEEVILAEIDRDAIQLIVKVSDLTFHPISGGFPRNKYLLLRGPSGYYIDRYIVAKYDEEFRPLQPWVDHAGDSVTDGGEMPTHWAHL